MPSGDRHARRPALESLEGRLLLDVTAEDDAARRLYIPVPLACTTSLFVENAGQIDDPSVRYSFQGQGLAINHTTSGPVFALSGAARTASGVSGTERVVFSADFPGAVLVEPVGLNPQEARVNVYRGNGPVDWRTDLPTYAAVAYPGLYDGVDLITYAFRDHLKYEFRVAPGADPSPIAIRYNGVTGLSLDDRGTLHIATALGELVDDKPVIYQETAAGRVEIPGEFRLLGDNTCSLVVRGPYDPSITLVIDPTLAWSSFLGGAGADYAEGVATDSSGNCFVTGYTTSADFPLQNALDTTLNGNYAVFVTKISPSGQLLWSTYLDGNQEDSGFAIATDSSGNVLITGKTKSTDWPTTGGFDTTYGGDTDGDAFVTKLTTNGAMVWSSYLGGTGLDTGAGIATDPSGNVLIVGNTKSTTGFPTAGGFATTYNGGTQDGFVTKISAAGALLWSSYLGGSLSDAAESVAADANGVYVTGTTSSTTGFPSTGVLGTTHAGGTNDAFLTRISPAGAIMWSGYLGGSGGEQGLGVAVDGSGNAFVTGTTASADFPASGGLSGTKAGSSDVFVAKVNAGGTRLWSGFLGGSMADIGEDIAVDAAGNAYVGGWSGSSDFPAPGGFDSTPHGGLAWEGIVFEVTGAGALQWSSLIGDSVRNECYDVAVDSSGNVFVVGRTDSASFGATGGFDTTFGGGSMDGYVARIVPDSADTLSTAVDQGIIGTGGFAIGGTIGDGAYGNKDVDLYRFEVDHYGFVGATLTGTLSGYLRLFNASASQVAAGSSLAGIFLAPGTYYIGVSGAGNSGYNPDAAGSGSAGATGAFALAITFAQTALPDLVVDTGGLVIGKPGSSVSHSFTVQETGAGNLLSGATWHEQFWVVDSDDTLDGVGWERLIWSGDYSATGVRNVTFNLPTIGATASVAGNVITEAMMRAGMSVVAVVDTADTVVEQSETNNTHRSTIAWLLPDLVPAGLYTSTAMSFGTANTAHFMSNLADTAYLPPGSSWREDLWLTDDGIADGVGWEKLLWSGVFTAGGARVCPFTAPSLGAVSSTTGNGVVTWSMIEAGMTLVARVDPAQTVVEDDETDNVIKRAAEWELPDLAVTNLTAAPGGPGEMVTLSYTTANTSSVNLAPGADWTEKIWLTDDGVVGNGGWEVQVWAQRCSAPGARTASVTMPNLGTVASTGGNGTVTAGIIRAGMRWVVVVDPFEEVLEKSGTNNTAAANAAFKLPDLRVARSTRPDVIFNHQLGALSYTVSNGGSWEIPAGTNWVEQVWLGTDANVLAANDPLNGVWHLQISTQTYGPGGSAMTPGATVERTLTPDLGAITLPAGISVDDLKWIVLLDWPSGDTALQADPGAVLETHEIVPLAPGAASKNAFVLSTNTQDVETGLLHFEVVNGAFTWTGSKYEATGTIQVGFTPDPGDTFSPLITVDGTFWYDSGKVHADGTVTANIGGLSLPIFVGTWEMPLGETQTDEVEKDAESSTPTLELAGVKFTLDSLAFTVPPGATSVHDGQIELEGKITLPPELGGLELAIADPNKVVIDHNGIHLTGAELKIPDVDFNLMGLVEVKAEDLRVKYISDPEAFKIQGKVTVPTLFDVELDFTDSEEDGERYIQVTNGGVDVVGVISAKDIPLGGPWKIDEVVFKFNTVADVFELDGKVTIPTGIQVDAKIGFIGSALNFVELGVSDGLNKPIGNTGAVLQTIIGRINHIAEADPEPISFGGSAGVTAGPQITVALPSWAGGTFTGSLVRLDVSADVDCNHLTADGTVVIIGGLATGEGSAELNWDEGFLSANAEFSMLAGLISYTASFYADSNYNVTMMAGASVSVPDIDELGFLAGYELGGATGYFEFRNDGDPSTDFVAGWGNIPVYGQAGIRVYFDGNWDLIGSEEIAAMSAASSAPLAAQMAPGGLAAMAAAPPASEVFHIDPGVTRLLLGAKWQNSASGAALQIRLPDGTVVDEADFGTFGIALVPTLCGTRTRALAVQHPASGNWTVAVTGAAGLGAVTFNAFRDAGTVPTITLRQPGTDVTGPMVDVGFEAFDNDSNAQISFYYDRDRTGFDGIPIVGGIAEQDGAGTYHWNTTGVPTGDYYLYAIIQDGENPPVAAYAPGRVTVLDPSAPGQVQNLDARWAGGNGVRLAWDALPGAFTYIVKYTADAAGEFYTDSVGIDGTQTIITGLVPDETYRFAVQAVDEAGHVGSESLPAIGIAGAAPIIPPGAGEWEVFADPATHYTEAIGLNPGDTAALVSGPAGASAVGDIFAWQVPPGAAGWNQVLLQVNSAGGGLDVIRRYVFSGSLNAGSIGGQVFDDLNADGIHNANDLLLNGWTVNLRDASTGEILATQATRGIDLNEDGTIDPYTEQGAYRFDNLGPGLYTISEIHAADWSPTLPVGPADRQVSLDAGQNLTAVDFGNDWVGFEMMLGGGHPSAVMYLDDDGTAAKVSVTGATAVVRFAGAGLTLGGSAKAPAVNGRAAVASVILSGTTPSGSLLFSGKGGNGLVQVGTIFSDGPMAKVAAKIVDLLGQGIVVSGNATIASLQVHNVSNGARIAMPGTNAAKGLTIIADLIDQGTDIALGSGLASLTASQWNSGTLCAPWVGGINIKGRKAQVNVAQLPGDCGASLNLTGTDAKGLSLSKFAATGAVTGGHWTLAGPAGALSMASTAHAWTAAFGSLSGGWMDVKSIAATGGDLSGSVTANSVGTVSAKGSISSLVLDLKRGPDARLQALGKLSAGNWIDACRVLSTGTIGSITAGGLRNSTIFAGVATIRDLQGSGDAPDGVLDLPEVTDLAAALPATNLLAGIRSLTLKGMKTNGVFIDSFINSNVAAGALGKIYLCYARFENDGNPAVHAVPFGLTGRTLDGLTYRDADPTHGFTWKSAVPVAPPAWFNDMFVQVG